MSKKLTISHIKNDNKRYKESVSIDIDVNGEPHEIKIYPFFSPQKVADLRDDFYSFLSLAKKEKVEIEIAGSDIIGYYVIKHFTDVSMTTSKKADYIYKEIKEVLNSKVAEFILKQFPQESMSYLYDKIYEIAELDDKLSNEIKRVQKEIQELPLENREIILGKQKQIPEV